MTATVDTPNYNIVRELLEELPNNPYTESKLTKIRSLYCKGVDKSKREIKCTDDEFYQFMYHLIRFGLDPFQGYIQCIKYSETLPAQIFLGKDALLAIVSRQPTFDGIEAGIFYRSQADVPHRATPTINDIAEQEQTKGRAAHPNDTPKMYSFARVYRKDRSRPTYVECPLKEYHRGNEVWNTRPETMIKKVAISQACRDAYPEIFAGLFTTEEFGYTEDSVFRPPVTKTTPITIAVPNYVPTYEPVEPPATVEPPTYTMTTDRASTFVPGPVPPIQPNQNTSTTPSKNWQSPELPTTTVPRQMPIDTTSGAIRDVMMNTIKTETEQKKKLGF